MARKKLHIHEEGSKTTLCGRKVKSKPEHRHIGHVRSATPFLGMFELIDLCKICEKKKLAERP